MIPAFIGILLVLVSMCVILFLLVKAREKRASAAEREGEAYSRALEEVKLRAERLRERTEKQERLEEAAYEERRELAGTPDSGLVSRANALFGVPDGSGE